MKTLELSPEDFCRLAVEQTFALETRHVRERGTLIKSAQLLRTELHDIGSETNIQGSLKNRLMQEEIEGTIFANGLFAT